MAVPNVAPFVPQDNATILNAIRKAASTEYQRRIPFVDKANIQATVRNLMDWTPTKNEFIDALVNRIGAEIFRQNSWANPYAKFKGGMLEWGDTIEEVFVGLINARVYDPSRPGMEQQLFGIHDAEVQTSFHKINRQDYYPISINDDLLRRAFVSDFGLSSLVTQLMEAPNKSDNWDEFLVMASLFAEYERADGFFHVNVPDLSVAESDGADARYALRVFRAWAGNLQFLSRNYNAAGMPVAATSDELELFITPEALAALDVDGLAAAFQLEKADIPYRINLITQEALGIPGCQAILTSRDFFVVRDTLFKSTQQPNAVGLHTNYFVHHHQIVSVSRFVPAVMFWTGPSDVVPTEVTPVTGIETITAYDFEGVTVTDFERGSAYQIRTAATTTGPNDSVRFEIISATSSTYTYIRPNGLITIAPDEEATSITVRVTAVDTDVPQIEATFTADIVGAFAEIWPNPVIIPDDDADGLGEVTPEEPAAVTNEDDSVTVTIPNVAGVQYRVDGVNVNNNTVHTFETESVVSAVARPGKELAAGVVASWTYLDGVS